MERTMPWQTLLLWSLILATNVFGDGLANQRGKTLNGKHLRLVYIESEGGIARQRDPLDRNNHIYVGVLADLWTLLSKSMNFTCSFIRVPPIQVMKKGPHDALIDFMLKKEADGIAVPQPLLLEATSKVDITFPFMEGVIGLLQPMPKTESRIFAVVRPFAMEVWIGLGVSIFAVAIALTVLTRATTYPSSACTRSILARNLMYISSMLIDQGRSFHSAKHVLRILAGTWCLVTIVFVYPFKTEMISSLTMPKYEPVLNTWEELAASDSKQIMVMKNSFMHRMIKNSNSSIFQRLEESLRQNPHHLVTNWEEADALLASGCCVLPAHWGVARLYLQRFLNSSSGECGLTLGTPMDGGVLHRKGIFLRKNSPHTEMLNRGIMALVESGLIRRFFQEKAIKMKVDKCIQRPISRPKQSPLSLYDLSSAFVILGVGTALSAVALLMEVLTKKFRSR